VALVVDRLMARQMMTLRIPSLKASSVLVERPEVSDEL